MFLSVLGKSHYQYTIHTVLNLDNYTVEGYRSFITLVKEKFQPTSKQGTETGLGALSRLNVDKH